MIFALRDPFRPCCASPIKLTRERYSSIDSTASAPVLPIRFSTLNVYSPSGLYFAAASRTRAIFFAVWHTFRCCSLLRSPSGISIMEHLPAAHESPQYMQRPANASFAV